MNLLCTFTISDLMYNIIRGDKEEERNKKNKKKSKERKERKGFILWLFDLILV